MTGEGFTIVVAVNDRETLRKNLYRSPGLWLNGRNQVLIREGFSAASHAYNSGIDEAKNDTVIFVHQDIYLPDTWFPALAQSLQHLESRGIPWGVLGCFGSRSDASVGVGRVYTNGLGVHGKEIVLPERVETLDEIVLIIRKSSGLRFDPNLPHFHWYGTDLCMIAREQGLESYAFQGFCVHNTNQLLRLPKEFYEGYYYVKEKWKKWLPIHASCMKVSLFDEEIRRRRVREFGELVLGRRRAAMVRVDDPRIFLNDNVDPI